MSAPEPSPPIASARPEMTAAIKAATGLDEDILRDLVHSFLRESPERCGTRSDLRHAHRRLGAASGAHGDGMPCVQSYVARVWAEEFGTGANIARTLVHDFFGGQGEEGVRKAMVVCGQYLRPTADHYIPPAVGQRLIDAAQEAFLDELGDLGS